MLKIGCHLSASGGFEKMIKDALSINANTFQFFTRNPRGGKAKKIDDNDVSKFLSIAKENNFAKVVAHAPYTLNACSKDGRIRQFAFETMADDMKRMEYIPGNYYNFHPGSHTGQGIEAGIQQISDMLNNIITENQSTIILLETMSGKGSEVGSRFEEIREIIDNVKLNDKLGVCLDTCHISDAGYDIVNDLDGVIKEFDSIIGLDRLKVIHLNDSKNNVGARKDRHEKIGLGFLGLDVLLKVINHECLRGLPFILETPNDTLHGYASEINLLRSKYCNQ